jgi:uroporphyrin-III C-methyltransferase/precorrin-2 dehydrogenase/sirohydrochlorin ferrochelatase
MKAAMDSLPIFLALSGRTVVIVGAGEAAEAKARLARAAGADIVGEAGAAGAALAFVALEDDGEAAAAAARLRGVGLLVNVVDKPAMSDFLMGAIIDRSPVLVAVSTGGASASLARALRARLEALLPDRLGALARAIYEARALAARAHPTPGDRRRLWDRLLAPGAALDPLDPPAVPETAVQGAVSGLQVAAVTRQVDVRVTSPDPGDLSANTLAVLGQCDTLVVVGAVAPAVIDRARRDAVRLDAVPAVWPEGITVVLRGD